MNKMTDYILKHSKKKDKELKYDFMPFMLEIIEKPAHIGGKVIIYSIFTLLIAVVVWSCLSKIDVVVTAVGSMTPSGNINVIKTYASGTVSTIEVSEGAYVEKGDVLITLDTEALNIDETQLHRQKDILTAQQELYKKISSGFDISKIKAEDYEENLRTYIQAILDKDKNYQNMLSNLEKEKSTAELNQQIAKIQFEEYTENGTQRQRDTQELLIQQYILAIEQINLQISDTKTQYSVQINSAISELENQIKEIDTQLEKYRISKEYQQITAPVSGYINSIAVNTIGEPVVSAQELVTIIPDDTPLEMVVYVKNMDIADIETGMEVEIKLEAYPYNKYGTVKGTVKYISPSSFVNEQMGSVYLVKIEVTKANDKINLISGLSGSVEIKTGKRTIMDYFLDPIKKGFGESLKEQ